MLKPKAGYTIIEFCIVIAIATIFLGGSFLADKVIDKTVFNDNAKTDVCNTVDMALSSYYRGHKSYPIILDILKNRGYLPANFLLDNYSYSSNGNMQGYVLETNTSYGVYRSPGSHVVGATDSAHGSQEFLTNGTFTVPPWVSQVTVTLIAGGNGGNGGKGAGIYGIDYEYAVTAFNGASGSQGKGMKFSPITVTPGESIAVTIGHGGTGGAGGQISSTTGNYTDEPATINGLPGSAGGTTSFGSYLSVASNSALTGTILYYGTGGAGGAAGTYLGEPPYKQATNGSPGSGPAGYFGTGGAGNTATNGTAYDSGGGGGGGGGASGYCLVEW